jgi:hypothetical protein
VNGARAGRRSCIILLLAVVAGCWPRAAKEFVDPTYDAAQARETLITALEAWQQGRVAQLARRKPPIRFLDDDARAGWQLLSYELADAQALIRPFQGVEVRLALRDRTGKEARRTALYQITLKPVAAVLRCDS